VGEMTERKEELDQLISRLSGVLAARAVLNEEGEIVEIHVLSDLSKSPKQLVRDVQSAIQATYGIEVDYKLISVAQVNGNMVMPAVQNEPRLLIRRITVSLDGQFLETTVVLAKGDQAFEGRYRGPVSGRSRIQSAAYACLDALKNYLGPSYAIGLLDLQRQAVAGNDCFIVALSYTDLFSERVLYGIAPIDSPETEVQSVVMAILSALNRPMTKPKKTSG